MIPAGWATEFVFQAEDGVLGAPSGRVFAGFHSVSFTLDVKHAATLSTTSPSRKMAGRRRFYPSYEISLEFMMHQTTSTLKLLSMLFTQASRITFAGYDVRKFDSSIEDDPQTATFWLASDDFNGKVMRLRGAAVQSIALNTPKTRGSVRLSVKLVALRCDYVDSMPGHNPEPPGAGLVTTIHSNAYFTTSDFYSDDLSPFAIPQLTSMSVKLSRSLEPAMYGRDGYPQRVRCKQRADVQGSFGVRSISDDIEDWINWNKEGASILRWGDTEDYRFEVLIPKCLLTSERLPIQSSESEIPRTIAMYAIQDFAQNSSAVLRTIRGYSDAMYFPLTFFGDLILDQVFGAYEAPFEVNVVGVQWSLQNACAGSNGSMRLINVLGEEIGEEITFADSEKSGKAFFYSPVNLLQGDVIKAKIKSTGSGESGSGLTANLIIETP